LVHEALAASLIGGIICLDRIFIQAMISRPIVAGACIGLVLQEPYTGLLIGALVELFWIDQSQIGTYIPPNDTIAVIVITAGTILSGKLLGSFSRELIALSILLFIPIGILSCKLDAMIIKANDGLSKKALEDAIKGNALGIEKKMVFALSRYFFVTAICIFFLTLAAAQIILWLYPVIPNKFFSFLKYVYAFIPLLGIAVALNTIHLKGMIPVFCGIFLFVTVLLDLI
jgi:PTS system mannose-specific IIC component